jgi:hypothetical protein
MKISYIFRKRERERVLDEKSIPASNIEVSWTTGDSIPHSVPTWFLPPKDASKIGALCWNF